jgi:hypothetical protein
MIVQTVIFRSLQQLAIGHVQLRLYYNLQSISISQKAIHGDH